MTDNQIQIPFAGGPDESTDPRLLPPGSVISAFNQVYDQEGQYQVRYGYTMLSGPPSSIFRLAVFAFELLAITLSGACYSFSPGDSAFVQRDASTPIGVTHAPLSNATSTYKGWGIADVNGYRVVGWIDAADNFPRASVYDQVTGAIVMSTQISTHPSLTIHVGSVGTTAILIVADGGSANIRAYTLTTAPLGAWSAGTVLSDGTYTSPSGIYTAAFGSSLFSLAWEQTNAGNSLLRVSAFNASLVNQFAQSTTLTAGTNTFFAIGSRITVGEQYWVGFYANVSGYANKIVAVELNSSTGVASTSFSVGFDTGGPSATSVQLGFERLSSTQQVFTASDGFNFWSLQLTTAGVVGGSAFQVPNVRSITGPVLIPSQSTCVTMLTDIAAANGGPATASYFLVDLVTSSPGTFPQLIAILAPSLASAQGQPTAGAVFPATPWQVNASGQFENVLPVARTTQVRQGLELFTLDPSANYRFSAATLGKESYFSGKRYDGRLLVENGFGQVPTFTAANNAGTGNSYQYLVTYGWIDNQGNFEESAPAAIQTVTSGATPNVTLSIQTTAMTRKQRFPLDATAARVTIVVYRTQKLSSGDTTFYRLTTEPFTLFDVFSAGIVTYTDTASDASITDGTHPVFYQTSGELAHNPPETFTHITVHKDRIWGIGADQRTIWWSQTYSDGTIPAWNFTFQITVDDAGEPLIALASLYDKLVVFTRSKIFVLYGDGPSIAGTGSDLQSPQRVPSTAGCIDPRSVVNTPMGIMFQSQRGLELLGPDLSVTFIGQPVSVTTANNPICTSAAFVEANSVIRFTLAQVDGIPFSQSGAIVNYDVRRGRWAVHRVTWGGSRGGGFFPPMQASVVHPTLGYVAAHNDRSGSPPLIYRENTAADALPWTDFGTFFVPLSVTTAWIKSGDLQGWQSIRRIRLLANYYDHHDLSVSLAYDYQSPAGDTHSYVDATIQAFRNGSFEQVLVIPGLGRRCEAVQVTVSTNSSSGFASGRGAGFLGLAFEVKPKQGGKRRIPTAARA